MASDKSGENSSVIAAIGILGSKVKAGMEIAGVSILKLCSSDVTGPRL
jgi:hypothetical protein